MVESELTDEVIWGCGVDCLVVVEGLKDDDDGREGARFVREQRGFFVRNLRFSRDCSVRFFCMDFLRERAKCVRWVRESVKWSVSVCEGRK